MSEPTENSKSFLKRFWIYQRERFPVFQHGILIIAFTFSSINYSLNARAGNGVPDLSVWITGGITSFLFFFLLRLFDEFKDAEEDARYRPYRPVPRGLISFGELKIMILVSLFIILVLNGLFAVRMLPIIAIVLVYLALMTKEFFVSDWLKAHPVIYMVSHMFIMPLFDLYTTGLDWHLQNQEPSRFLLLFLIISFFNGMVIETGRKIRSADIEEPGVETYSRIWGEKKSVLVWSIILTSVFIFSLGCMFFLSYSLLEISLLLLMYMLSLFFGYRFYQHANAANSKSIETLSGIWTLSMYLLLGGISGLWRLINLF